MDSLDPVVHCLLDPVVVSLELLMEPRCFNLLVHTVLRNCNCALVVSLDPVVHCMDPVVDSLDPMVHCLDP